LNTAAISSKARWTAHSAFTLRGEVRRAADQDRIVEHQQLGVEDGGEIVALQR
jgi:hypothetical protein